MKFLQTDNYIIPHYAPTLEDTEYNAQSKLNAMQKILLKQNRKTFTNAILRIGTMIASKRRNK